MAQGLLGKATSAAYSSSVADQIVYTVPDGKYAVVHITLVNGWSERLCYDLIHFAALPRVTVDNVDVLRPTISAAGAAAGNSGISEISKVNSSAISMMLSAGNVVRVNAGRNQQGTKAVCTVSGYEVDV